MAPTRGFRPLALAALAAGLLLSAGLTTAAQARVFFGFGFPLYYGPPVYPPPPVYVPPPVYYPPPPPVVIAPPPPPYSPYPYRQSCYAGRYVCPMERPVAPGSGCYCTVNGQRIWGRAN